MISSRTRLSWRGLARRWVESIAVTGDRRYGGSTRFFFRGAVFALGVGGTLGIVAIGDDE